MRQAYLFLALLLPVASSLACSSADHDETGSTDQTSALTFHGEADPIPGFDKKLDLKADGIPAEATFEVSASGKLSVDAGAKRDGKKLVGIPGSGKVSLDLHFKMAGHLKVDTALKSYDGDIPGLANLDIPITGSVPFDPFLVGDTGIDLAAAVPTTALPEIPLGTIPGSLLLTVQPDSRITTSFKGICLSTKNGKATYAGAATTSGSLVIKATLKLDLPFPLNKSIDLPDITVPLPSAATPLDLGSIDAKDLDDVDQGTCGAATAPAPPTPDPHASSKSDAPDAGPSPHANAPAATCNTLDPATAPYIEVERLPAGTPHPTLGGGVVLDGTWILTAAKNYGTLLDDFRVKRVLKVAGANVDTVDDFDDGAGAVTWSGTWAFSQSTVQHNGTCPDHVEGAFRPFEATPNRLRVYYEEANLELIYTRQ